MPKLTNNRAFARWSAKVESYLSTNAFTLIFFCFYFAVLLLMFFWGAVGEFKHTEEPVMRWFISVARGFGYILNINTAFVILLAARLFFTWIRETPLNKVLPIDKAFPQIHIIVGYVIAVSVVFHASFHMVWLVGWNEWAWGLWNFNQSVITGFLLLIVLSVMVWFARPKVRAQKFHLFYLVHIVGAILFFVLLIFHGMYRTRPETYKYVIPPLVIYFLDRVCRKLKISNQFLQLSAENSVFKERSVLELRAPKPFDYRAGQYAEIMVPSINREWHPFTIASANHEDTICFYIKALGDWTNALHKAFQDRLDGTIERPLDVKIRGPYGAPAQHVNGYERVVLISGGIGATPFSAICKELHHLNTNENKEVVSGFQNESHIDEKIEKRVRSSISSIYSVDIENLEKNTEEEREQQSRFITDMLNLTSTNINGQHSHHHQQQAQQEPNEDDLESGFKPVVVDDEDNESSEDETESNWGSFMTASGLGQADEKETVPRAKTRPTFMKKKHPLTHRPGHEKDDVAIEFDEHSTNWQRMARKRFTMLYSTRSRVLAFLHTTRFMFCLLLALLARIVIICMGDIFSSEYVMLHPQNNDNFIGLWVIIADTSLSVLLAIALPLTIILELSFMGSRYFSTFGRTLDLFTFVPMAILSAVLGIRTCILKRPDAAGVIFAHYVVILPLMFALLLLRMYRSVGSRGLLSDPVCKCEKKNKIPDVDFVWTSPKDGDDKWLLNELEPLAEGTKLRLHRYLTREKSEEVGEKSVDGLLTKSKAGRPQWDELFQRIAEQAPSHSDIGVFFCGPHPMGAAIQKSLRKIEVVSNLRGAYLRSANDKVLAEDLLLKSTYAVEKLRTHGCSVRFVFREENFG